MIDSLRATCRMRPSIKFILISDISWIHLTSFVIFRASLSWQVLLCGKLNVKTILQPKLECTVGSFQEIVFPKSVLETSKLYSHSSSF